MTQTQPGTGLHLEGIRYGVAAYTLWGLLPLYWKILHPVPPLETLAHRIFWSFLFMLSIAFLFRGRLPMLAVCRERKKLFYMFLCGVIISFNWYTYIIAVNTDRVIEASMGYYITPLVVVLLGVSVLKEKLSRAQLAAIILAASGVSIIAFQYGRIPWVALILAFTFSTYGLTKKVARVDPVTGMVLETAAVAPLALIYILSLEVNATAAASATGFTMRAVLAAAGLVTVTPLLLYARGLEKTTFSMMGFLQYIAPTMTLLLGIFVFQEEFSAAHSLSFGLIWAGLLIFTLSNIGLLKPGPLFGPQSPGG